MRPKHGRGSMTDRLLRLMQLVYQGQPLPPLSELAVRFDVSTRTIRRDLEAIELLMPLPEIRKVA